MQRAQYGLHCLLVLLILHCGYMATPTWHVLQGGPRVYHLGSVVIHVKKRNLLLLFSEYKENLQNSKKQTFVYFW